MKWTEKNEAFATGVRDSPEIIYILMKKAEEDKYLQVVVFAIMKAGPKSAAAIKTEI